MNAGSLIRAFLIAGLASQQGLAGQAAAGSRDVPQGPAQLRHLGPPAVSDRPFEEVRRYAAREARQGVAVDAAHFYAVDNAAIGKYERAGGRKIAEWSGDRDGRITHLNSCLVVDAQLVCAHSNYPGVPMVSSIETFDAGTLEHLRSRSFGVYEGSLTWALPREAEWWLNFANYAGYGGTPGQGPEWTTLVRFDAQGRRRWGYVYPVELIERITPRSLSGGNWGPDGRLYVTGHDQPEIYVLRLPDGGSVLEWVETIPAPMRGQAWAFDPTDPDTVWGIVRATREVVVGTRR